MRREVLNSARLKEIKKKKRCLFYLKIGGVVTFCIFLVIGLGQISKLEKVTIDNVVVRGNRALTESEIKQFVDKTLEGNYLFIFSRRSAILYPRRSIKRYLLSNYRRIESLSVNRIDLKTIEVDIVEREPKYLWCNEGCYFADKVGYIFDEAPKFSGPIYFIFRGPETLTAIENPIGRNLLSLMEFERLINFSMTIGRVDPRLKAVELSLRSNGEYEFTTKVNGAKIKFKKENNFESIWQNLLTAISAEPLKTELKDKFQQLDYIDLRFDNKVYYKFKE